MQGRRRTSQNFPGLFPTLGLQLPPHPTAQGQITVLELVLYRDSPTFAVGQTPAQQGAQDRGSETVLVLAQLTPR